MLRPRRSLLLPALSAVGLLWGISASAQIPDEFKNLKVLPKDIGKRELVSVMRDFTDALGVRCNHCHVPGPTPGSLEGFDFASDEPKAKNAAREMMKMVKAINHDFIAKAGIENPKSVACITCHRGVKEPETLDHLLLAVVEKDGVAAAQNRYRELRENYYGTGSYDFSPGTLDAVAEKLAEGDKNFEGAIAMAKLNMEFHPEDAGTHVRLGQIYAAQGKTEDAVKSLERALELDPENERIRQMIEKLRGGK